MKTYIKKIEAPLLKIFVDDCPESPREWSNLGYFISIDRNYYSPDNNDVLIDIINSTQNIAGDIDEHMKLIKKEIKEQMGEKVLYISPVTKYEHSAVYYRLGEVHGFDYSCNSFYIVTDRTQKIFGTPKKLFEKVIKNELETYNSYINGEVYGYILYDENGEKIDSCYGFYYIEDIKENLPEEWEDENMEDYFINK